MHVLEAKGRTCDTWRPVSIGRHIPSRAGFNVFAEHRGILQATGAHTGRVGVGCKAPLSRGSTEQSLILSLIIDYL